MRRLVVIAGPTASGKSALAVTVAQRLGAEVVSADSRQVYRELELGVAKPSAAQLAAVRHHLVSHRSIHEPYSAAHWARDAREAIETSFRESGACVVVGGSGLHVRALVEGIPDMPPVPPAVRAHYGEALRQNGLAPLLAELEAKDPAYHAHVDRANPHRILRALGVIAATGQPFTHWRAQPRTPLPYPVEWLVLDPPRAELYARIDARVDAMVAAGLEEEARGLYSLRALDALQTIGYREWWPVVEGTATRQEAIARIKQATRHFARRQATWNRQLPGQRFASLPDAAAAVHANLGAWRQARDSGPPT